MAGVTVAILAAGAMGAAVGQRLREGGARVLTSLAGRGAATIERARRAGLVEAASDAELVGAADIVLSIVPPGEAAGLAARLRPALADAARPPLYADCNAVSPDSVRAIAAALAPAGCPFVDVGTIGGPPKPGAAGPKFYGSGPAAGRLAVLRDYGLDVRPLDGPVGAASALKMSYASLTKGLTALGAAMMLAAERSGAAAALRAELADSQPALHAWLARQVPAMYPKAYRWVAEMEEIARFLGEGTPEATMFEGAARLYERLAGAEGADDLAALDRFLAAARRG
jgi:3-hydroxyisobutyrate dehydrogenase-like beta-hydroxyacid dehydrogenase